MQKFCIFRVKKLHDDGNVGGAVAHHFRSRQTDNANPAEIENDVFFPAEGRPNNADKSYRERMHERAMAIYRKKLPKKTRKNAVKACELLITTSNRAEILQENPDFDFKGYLREAKKWAFDKFGRDNFFCIAEHWDETTPHLSMLFVPKVDGKLNARHYFGGAKKIIELQNDFAENVGQKFGLERGQRNSHATHKEIRQFYGEEKEKFEADVNQFHEKGLFESKRHFNERLATQLRRIIKNDTREFKKQADEANFARLDAERAKKETDDALKSANRQIEDLKKTLNDQIVEKNHAIEQLKSEQKAELESQKERLKKEFDAEMRQKMAEKDKKIDDLHDLVYENKQKWTFKHSKTGEKIQVHEKGLMHQAEIAHNWQHFTPQILRETADEIEQKHCNNWAEVIKYDKKQPEIAPKTKQKAKGNDYSLSW